MAINYIYLVIDILVKLLQCIGVYVEVRAHSDKYLQIMLQHFQWDYRKNWFFLHLCSACALALSAYFLLPTLSSTFLANTLNAIIIWRYCIMGFQICDPQRYGSVECIFSLSTQNSKIICLFVNRITVEIMCNFIWWFTLNDTSPSYTSNGWGVYEL